MIVSQHEHIFMGLLTLMPLFTVLHTIPSPVNVTILSHNFNHILQWSPGRNSPPQTVFNLKPSCYEKSPMQLNIRNTTVDVSGVLEDIYTPCTFSVWASLDNMTSRKRKLTITPYEDTIIGPPTVHLSGCGDCLKIKISLPKGSGKKDQLLQFYTSVSFKVSWKKAGENKSNEIWISSGKYLLQNLQAGDQYCVRVLPWINSNRNTRPSAWQCEYTSKEEPRGVVYLVSWSLGATISGLCVLVLAVSLFYTGSVCKIMTPLPKPMINIAQAHYLHPEQTVTESVSLPDDQLMSRFENNPTKNNHTLNVQQHLQEERRDEKNYANKVDTEDENDYDDEDEEGGCTYMGCVINHSDLESNNCEENSLHDCSGVCHTEDEAALDLVVIMPSQLECEEEVMSEMSAEITRPEITETQLEKNAPGYSSGNVNLFSVTLSALGPQEDNEELCEPLIPKPLESEVLQVRIPLMTIRTAEEFEGTSASVQTEIIKTDVLMSIGSLLSVCSPVLDIQNESDTVSGYMVTHSGHMHKQNTDSSEESDYCDTNYITR